MSAVRLSMILLAASLAGCAADAPVDAPIDDASTPRGPAVAEPATSRPPRESPAAVARGSEAPAEPPSAPEAPGPVVVAFALEGCQTAIAAMPVPAANVQTLLPEGFIPLTPEELLGQPDPRGDALLMLMVQSCRRAVGPSGTASYVPAGDVHIPVRDPALGVAADLHAVRLDPLVADAKMAGLLRDAGANVASGTVAFIEDGPVGPWRHVRATMDAGGPFVVEGMPAVPVTGRDAFRYAAYTPVTDGLAVWETSLANRDFTVGEGHAELPPGWLRDAAGTDWYALPYVLYVLQDQVDGRLTIP